MLIFKSFVRCIFFGLILHTPHLSAQNTVQTSAPILLENPRTKTTGEIKLGLEKLSVLGSVLYLAAHPDDENTRLISWLANEKKYRTAYLSLTRGDGGQNLLGLELGVELGLIRSQEMMAARSFDHGEQFFSSAYDFGFSKTHTETFQFWNKEEVLKETVYIIRKFKPDVIVNRFPPDERGGHGHHQASAIIAHEAFLAAADPKRFPEQVKEFGVWKPKRIVWNTANFGGQNNTSDDQLMIDIGAYNPLLGQSYGEMAAISRSQHKSQGFGAASTRGKSIEYFKHVDGTPAKTTLMDDVATNWMRLESKNNPSQLLQQIQGKVNELIRNYNMDQPEKSIDGLIQLYKAIQLLDDPYWKTQKSKEIQELILACSGLFLEAIIDKPSVVLGSQHEVQLEAIMRSPSLNIQVLEVNKQKIQQELEFNQNYKKAITYHFDQISQPYWLRKPGSLGKFDVSNELFGQPLNVDDPALSVSLNIQGLVFPVKLSIMNRFVDPVRGEIHEPIRIVPALTVQSSTQQVLFSKPQEQIIELSFIQNGDLQKAKVQLKVEGAFTVSPSQLELDFTQNSTQKKSITVYAKLSDLPQVGKIQIIQGDDTTPLTQSRLIQYDHIPSVSWQKPFEIQLRSFDLQVPVKKVAYLPGAGDLIPDALKSLGIQVDVVDKSQLHKQALEAYDALIIGVRAYNVDDKLPAFQRDILNYVESGGVVLVQYQVNTKVSGSNIGPYPFEITRSRVTDELAEVDFLLPNDVILQTPNKISEADFENWVQERGLYFVEKVDKRYRSPLSMHDQGEKAHSGALIVTNYGKGKFVYTSLSLFRQLPAGVPGSYRLLMNLLAKPE